MTRAELYDLVWSEPIVKIAPRYGMSDRGMGKLCARYSIPVPPRGYWARKAAGKRVSKPPLPNPTSDRPVVFPTPKPPTPNPAPDPVTPEIEFERDPANFIIVEPLARLTHPVVRKAATMLRSMQPGHDGILRRIDCLDIRVSRACLTRALRLMQALLVALEKRKYKVTVKERTTQVVVLDEPIEMALREHLKRTRRVLDDGSGRYVFDTSLTGELQLHAGHVAGRGSVADGARERLEDRLNTFVEVLVRQALEAKRRRAERERREMEWREAERQRKERERGEREEQHRIQHFDELVKHWRATQDRRAFLAELRTAVGSVERDSELGDWMEWAAAYVEDSDPLVRFRTRAKTLTVYMSGYKTEIDRIKVEGFRDAELSEYGGSETRSGIKLQDQVPASDWITEAIEIELPEEVLLPYEMTEPGYVPRTFYVPARLLNRYSHSAKLVPAIEQ